MNRKTIFCDKIESGDLHIGVIGLGEVGLRLALAFATEGFMVHGFEQSAEKRKKISQGESYIRDIESTGVLDVVRRGKLRTEESREQLKSCDAIFICVPTPLDEFKKPDMRFIREACETIGKHLQPGTFVCLESTTYPTTTEDYIRPMLEEISGLSHDADFWLAYSPERVDPGNAAFSTRNTPKILGALSPDGLEIGQAVYRRIADEVIAVSSPRVAEMAKILENTYRLVNISLVNELALLCGKMDINIWEVIEAAKTKPYGFQAFYPGPGIGGHCIPLDPFYLEYIAQKFGFDLSLIHTAGHINNLMPHRMTIKITSALNRHKKAINGSRVVFLGVAYKPDSDDFRESPALKIIDEVQQKGGDVAFHDPLIATAETPKGLKMNSCELSPALLQQADCVVVCTRHRHFDPDFIRRHSILIVDLQNLFDEPSENVYKL